jgi:ATP-binding cassette subfamily A (ABC1) protein 3
MNMLTGMLSPTSGSASIQGLDIETQMVAIRKTIGCCPQHDILWEQLTVHQHLETFARLKGLDPATCVAAKIAEVGLTEKVLTKAGELSGGMKRKLSLCMALIGEPTVVFLDEPTSGMDPFSRRSTWNMLQSSRAGRAMVLTTHFMDEVSHVI